MAIDDILELINKGVLSRRTFLEIGVSAGMGLAGLSLAGCIGSNKPGATPQPSPSVIGQLSVDPLDLLDSSPLMVSLTDFQDISEFTDDAVYDTSFSTPGNQWS